MSKKLYIEKCQVVHSGNKRKNAKYPWKKSPFPCNFSISSKIFFFFVDAPIVISWWDFVAAYLALREEVGSANSEWRTWLFLLGKLWEAFFARRDYCHWIWVWSFFLRPQYDWLNAKYVASNHVTKRLMQESWSSSSETLAELQKHLGFKRTITPVRNKEEKTYKGGKSWLRSRQ